MLNTSMHHVPPISPTPTLENAHPNAQPIILHRASSKPFGGYQSQYLKTLTARTSCQAGKKEPQPVQGYDRKGGEKHFNTPRTPQGTELIATTTILTVDDMRNVTSTAHSDQAESGNYRTGISQELW